MDGVLVKLRGAARGRLASSPRTGAGMRRTACGGSGGHARRRTRDTAPRRGIDGAAPARPPAGGHGRADAPPGVAWWPPRQGAGRARSADGPSGHARRRMRRTDPRRGSARVLGGRRPARGAVWRCGCSGLPGRGGRRAAPSGKSGTPAGEPAIEPTAAVQAPFDNRRGRHVRVPVHGHRVPATAVVP